MFNFINGLVLPLLIAAAIPLILHLLNRQKLRVIPFSSLRFLKELQNQRLRQIKLYQILIIILRMLFIIFLVLAFARPTLRSVFLSGGNGARVTAVIIVDNSYSMQAQKSIASSFDRAREALRKILRSFDDKDRVFVLNNAPDLLNRVLINNKESLNVSQLKVSNMALNFSDFLFKAHELFQKFPNFNRELYWITDAHIPQSALNDSARALLNRSKARLIVVDVADEGGLENVSIDSAFFATRLIEQKRPVKVIARLHNVSDREKNVTVSLFNNQARLAMQVVTVGPHKSKQVPLQFTPMQTGFFELKVEIDDDDVMIDNQYYLAMYIPERVNVLYVQNSPPPEISSVLRVLEKGSNFRIRQTDFDRWFGEDLNQYQIVVLNDPPAADAALVAHLKQFLESGKSIVLLPGLTIPPTDYNRLTDRLFGVKPFLRFIKAEGTQQFFTIKNEARARRLLENVFLGQSSSVEMPHFFRYFKLKPVKARVDLNLNNDDPLLLHWTYGKKGSFWMLSSGLSSSWGNFPLTGLYLPFWHQLLALAGEFEQQASNFETGKPVALLLRKGTGRGEAGYRLKPPSSEAFNVLPQQTSTGLRFEFEGFATPGHYRIFSGNSTLQMFTVNVSSREWQEPFLKFEDFHSAQIIKYESLSAERLKKGRLGFELWPYFLALALLMLFLEMFVIRRLEGKPV